MKKHSLAENYERFFGEKLIGLLVEKRLKEDYEDEDSNDTSAWAQQAFDDDGWNKDFMEDIRLMEALDEARRMKYELDNTIRGSFYFEGESPAAFVRELQNLIDKFQYALNRVEELEEY